MDTDPFRLRADVEVDGAVYRPYGTSVCTRLLVVDRAPEDSPRRDSACVEAVVGTVGEAVDVLASAR